CVFCLLPSVDAGVGSRAPACVPARRRMATRVDVCASFGASIDAAFDSGVLILLAQRPSNTDARTIPRQGLWDRFIRSPRAGALGIELRIVLVGLNEGRLHRLGQPAVAGSGNGAQSEQHWTVYAGEALNHKIPPPLHG